MKTSKNLSSIRIVVTTGLCLSSGILSAILFDRFKDSQIALFTLPGILFGLAIVVSNFKVFANNVGLPEVRPFKSCKNY
ncbi:hypothetical protein GCM10027443_09780 [Pontibacter brevis]